MSLDSHIANRPSNFVTASKGNISLSWRLKYPLAKHCAIYSSIYWTEKTPILLLTINLQMHNQRFPLIASFVTSTILFIQRKEQNQNGRMKYQQHDDETVGLQIFPPT
jgi:hypothetical protein